MLWARQVQDSGRQERVSFVSVHLDIAKMFKKQSPQSKKVYKFKKLLPEYFYWENQINR
jgi:hypothetical protein